MIFLIFLLGYFAIGLVVLGALLARQWWLTRNFIVPILPRELLVMWIAGSGLWPIILYQILWQGLPKFDDESSSPEIHLAKLRARSLREFARKMPPCHSIVRMVASDYQYNEESVGVFYFEAEQVYQEISNRVRNFPSLGNDDEGQLLKWLNQRQLAEPTPTDVPMGFGRFSVCADVLVRRDHGYAECLLCKQTYPVQRLTFRDDSGGSQKSNFNEIICPSGHRLLKRLRIRFF